MRKIAGIALITGLIGLIGIFIFRNEIFPFGNEEQFTDAKNFTPDSINQLDIDVNVADLHVEKSPDQSIHVSLNGYVNEWQRDKMNYQAYNENNTLFIKLDQRDSWWFSFSIFPFQNNRPLELVLQLPDKQFEKLTVDSNVADISINTGEFSSVDIASDVGDIQIGNTKATQVSVETNLGDIDISDGAGRYDLVSDVGEISLDLLEWNEDVMIESDVGDIEVFIQQMPKAFQMNLDSDVGGVHTTGVRQDRAENDDGNVYIEVGTDGPLMDIRSDVGEIDVISQ